MAPLQRQNADDQLGCKRKLLINGAIDNTGGFTPAELELILAAGLSELHNGHVHQIPRHRHLGLRALWWAITVNGHAADAGIAGDAVYAELCVRDNACRSTAFRGPSFQGTAECGHCPSNACGVPGRAGISDQWRRPFPVPVRRHRCPGRFRQRHGQRRAPGNDPVRYQRCRSRRRCSCWAPGWLASARGSAARKKA